jgi:translation elongation factor EF-Tu-like GTPase
MNTMTVLVVAGMAATILSLVQGIASMADGGAEDQARSHILMFRRVGLQSLTLVLLVLAVLSQGM